MIQPTRLRVHQQPSLLDLIVSSDESVLTNIEYDTPIGISNHLTLTGEMHLSWKSRLKTVISEKAVINYPALNDQLQDISWDQIFLSPSVSENWNIFNYIARTRVERS